MAYGLTGFQNEVVEAIRRGLVVAAHRDESIAMHEANIAKVKALAIKNAEGSNEATRKANAEIILADNEAYNSIVESLRVAVLERSHALAEVEAAKVAARFITATIAAGSPA